MPAQASDPSTLAIVSPFITWFLVVFGWLVVHYTSGLRARRQEELAWIADMAARIIAIRDHAIEYFRAGSDAPELTTNQARLRYELQSLGARLQAKRDQRKGYYDLDSEQIALRQAVTGGDFESKDRTAADPSSKVIQALWFVSDQFIVALDLEFEKANKSVLLRG